MGRVEIIVAEAMSRSSWRRLCRDHRGGGAGTRLRRPPLATFEPTGTRLLF